MKKIIAIILAVLMLVCFASCGKKVKEPANEEPATTTSAPEEETEPVEQDTDEPDSPELAAEYTAEYWEAKYPGENVCPFMIEVDGVEYDYYRVSSLDDGTMRGWIETPLNWDGWHLVGEDIVNKDETYKMTDSWGSKEPEEFFSSYCTVTTEEYTPANAE